MYDETYPVPAGVAVDPWTRTPLPAPACTCAAAPDDAALLALILALLAGRPQLGERLAARLLCQARPGHPTTAGGSCDDGS